jgi:choloylglycine hydrolase
MSTKPLKSMRTILVVLIVMVISTWANCVARACTGITLTGSDNSVVRGRTVEWGTFDIKPRLAIIPRGVQFSSQTMPDGQVGITWKAKYGVIATDALNRDVYVDGINEKGLSLGIFYLPGFAKYGILKGTYLSHCLGLPPRSGTPHHEVCQLLQHDPVSRSPWQRHTR